MKYNTENKFWKPIVLFGKKLFVSKQSLPHVWGTTKAEIRHPVPEINKCVIFLFRFVCLLHTVILVSGNKGKKCS